MEDEPKKQEAEEKAKRFIPRGIQTEINEVESLRRAKIQEEALQEIRRRSGWD